MPKAIKKLVAFGLGSCVGIVLFDLSTKIAGMGHILLPGEKVSSYPGDNLLKYAPVSIRVILEALCAHGAKRESIQAKIAGGSNMFSSMLNANGNSIGSRNIESVKNLLEEFQIELVSEAVGGDFGRTIEFDPNTGKLYIKSLKGGDRII